MISILLSSIIVFYFIGWILSWKLVIGTTLANHGDIHSYTKSIENYTILWNNNPEEQINTLQMRHVQLRIFAIIISVMSWLGFVLFYAITKLIKDEVAYASMPTPPKKMKKSIMQYLRSVNEANARKAMMNQPNQPDRNGDIFPPSLRSHLVGDVHDNYESEIRRQIREQAQISMEDSRRHYDQNEPRFFSANQAIGRAMRGTGRSYEEIATQILQSQQQAILSNQPYMMSLSTEIVPEMNKKQPQVKIRTFTTA